MSRSYRGVRPQTNRVYSVDQVRDLYGVSRNTLNNWVGSGLHPVDARTPQLFHGGELARFHRDRAGTTATLLQGQFNCFGCKRKVFPDPRSVAIEAVKTRANLARATCPDCHVIVLKLLGEAECNNVRKCLDTNTSLASIDEGREAVQAGIGKEQGAGALVARSQNDRIIFAWQGFAGRFDKKTVTAHLISIRAFERFFPGRAFGSLDKDDIVGWREALIANACGLGNSTIRHRASQVGAFLKWLANEPGHTKLRGLSEYCLLPRKLMQAPLPEPKLFPDLGEAGILLDAMPAASLHDRRQRAIFAMAFLIGLRANALITLRLKHVDVDARRVVHDGAAVRAKNGKSFDVNWFPRTAPFEQVVRSWLDEVTALGLRRDDAIFPKLRQLKTAGVQDRPTIDPMKTADAVTEAFDRACAGRGPHYTPHSARHTLANLGDKLCRTSEERKAWSLNFGHETEAVTWEHYGKVSGERKDQIFESFDRDVPPTADEAELMLRYHEHELIRGTPEFDRAARLVEERRDLKRRGKAGQFAVG